MTCNTHSPDDAGAWVGCSGGLGNISDGNTVGRTLGRSDDNAEVDDVGDAVDSVGEGRVGTTSAVGLAVADAGVGNGAAVMGTAVEGAEKGVSTGLKVGVKVGDCIVRIVGVSVGTKVLCATGCLVGSLVGTLSA